MQQYCSCGLLGWLESGLYSVLHTASLLLGSIHFPVRSHKSLPRCTIAIGCINTPKNARVSLCVSKRKRQLWVSDATFVSLTTRHPLYRQSTSCCVAMASPWDRLLSFSVRFVSRTHTHARRSHIQSVTHIKEEEGWYTDFLCLCPHRNNIANCVIIMRESS